MSSRLAMVFHALANDDRLRLVEEIARDGGGLTIAQLSARIGVSRFSASRHLSILREVGIVYHRRVGVKSIHTIEPSALESVEDWLYPLVDAPSDQAVG